MSALPHRHHGGDRLHRAANGLPASSKHIMTPNRWSDRAVPNRSPDRVGEGRAARISGAIEQKQIGQNQAGLTVWRRGRRGQQHRTDGSTAQIARSAERWLASTPIAPAAGERFSPIRFSLTGAASTLGTPAVAFVRRAAKRKTLSIIALIAVRAGGFRFQDATGVPASGSAGPFRARVGVKPDHRHKGVGIACRPHRAVAHICIRRRECLSYGAPDKSNDSGIPVQE